MQRILVVGALLLIVVSGAGNFPARLHAQAKYLIAQDPRHDAEARRVIRTASGSRELTADPVLATLEIIPQGGPSLPRNGSMAQATGCLENREGRWLLTNSTEPQRTKLEAASADELKAAASAALGNGTVELISVFPSPAPHIGRRLRAKGLLVLNPAGNKINVMSLEVIAQACTP